MSLSGRIIDVSVPISPALPVWPGDPPVRLEATSRVVLGDSSNVSRLEVGTHAGTHVDPPYHFLADGGTVDHLSLEALVGPCWVCDLTGLDRNVTAADLETAGIPDTTRRLLLKTRNSGLWSAYPTEFVEEFLALEPDAARWVVERGIAVVGIDYLSIEPFNGSGDTHHILLGAGVIPIEGLNLTGVAAGPYTLVCLPLLVSGGDGAPCRTVLVDESPG